MGNPERAGVIERIGTGIDAARRWGNSFWRLSVLMAKGAYLLQERKRLFGKLGEEVYERVRKGELKSPALEPLVHQLDRLTKKVEIEEMLVRSLRFGQPVRSTRDAVKET
jgi:hypothetical protein